MCRDCPVRVGRLPFQRGKNFVRNRRLLESSFLGNVVDRFALKQLIATPLHPPLIAVYPVLYLLGRNAGNTVWTEGVRSAVLLLIVSFVVWGIVWTAARNSRRSATVVSVLFIAFFTYDTYSNGPLLVTLVLLVVIGLIVQIFRSRSDFVPLTRALNVFAIILVLYSVVAIASAGRAATEYRVHLPEASAGGTESSRPNIYYIILDGYGSEAVFRRFYDLDIGPFVRFLEGNRFYVHDRARTNYPWTVLSLATSLNFIHAKTIAEEFNLSGSSNAPMLGTIYNNRVMAFLRGQGYTTHAYLSGYMRDNFVGADEYYRPWWRTSEFEGVLANFTPIPDIVWNLPLSHAYDIHRETLLETVGALERSVDLPGPKFVFGHLMCPHPPFVFTRDGEPRNPDTPHFSLEDGSKLVGKSMTAEEYRTRYADQVIYLNTLLRRLVQSIVDADPESVIILQGDHGPASMADWTSIENTNHLERFAILNAVHLPDDRPELERAFVTPVNTFRHIFNLYFDTAFEPAPDKSFFVLDGAPFVYYEMIFPEQTQREP